MVRTLASARRLPRPVAVLLSIALAVFFVPFTLAGTASAQVVGNFEIDGNLVDDAVAGIDWASLSPGDAGFATDVDHTTGTQDDTAFGGGSKEYNDGGQNGWPTWVYGGGNVAGKSDFGRWATYTQTIGGHVWLDLGFDRDFSQGTAKYAFELNQIIQSNTSNANPTRSQGDLRFIVWDQGNGSITLTGDAQNTDVGLYKWVDPDQGANGTAEDTNHNGHWVKDNSNGTFVGAVNSTTVSVPSWWTSLNVKSGGLAADTFVEFGVDLTSFGAVLGCPSSGFAAVNARSITGTGTTGQLMDYLKALPVHIPSTCSSLVTDATATATIGSAIHDTATVTPSDAQGTVTFKLYGPNDATCSGSVLTTLGPVAVSGGTASSGDYTPAAVGTYRWVASYTSSDTSKWSNSTGKCNDANEQSVITKKQPGISTTALASATLPNAAIHDTAHVTNLTADATGTVTFNLYGPGDTSCSNSIWSNSQPLGTVTGGAANVQSDDHVVTAAGTYRWIASYGGDAKNAAVSGQCNDANEATVVNKAVSAISTTASEDKAKLPDVTISDTASLTGVTADAGGSIVFKLYGPETSAQCLPADLVFTSSPVAVNGPGTYGPVSTMVQKAGTYYWVAAYSGDGNNLSVAGSCGDANESADVGKASPAISTSATGASAPGGQVHDTATLTGLSNSPTGTVTFSLYGPSASADCSGAAVFTATAAIVPGAGGTATASSGNFTVANAGSYWWTATYSGDANNATAVSGCGAPNERSDVGKAHPQITTAATSTSLPGGTIHDVATVSGLSANATGTVTFNLYGPSANPDCSGAVKFSATVGIGSVSGGTATASSGNFSPTTAGKYYWIASYSGDANNDPTSGSCGDSGETSTVTPATPAISTSATATAQLPDGTLNDSAHLTGLTSNATGTVVFRLYGPEASATCGTLVYTSPLVSITNNGNGTADAATPAPGYSPTVVGTYHWVASYSGDVNNAPVAGTCGDSGETSTVTPASPTIATSATVTAQLPAGTVHDTATVSGLTANATGTVTFNLYGPSAAADCSGSAVFTSTKPLGSVSGGVASATSADFTPTAAGNYWWIASYSGDANNNKVAGSCGDSGEKSIVTPAQPAITTTATVETTLPSGTIHDVAHLTGLTNDATGTVTFKLWGPSVSPDCSGNPVFTDSGSLGAVSSHTANVTSGSFTPTQAGSYWWIASYGGDANNKSVSGACGDDGEMSQVFKASPTIATSATDSSLPGATIHDTATVSGLSANATGTVQFQVWGPSATASCDGTPVKTVSAALGSVVNGVAVVKSPDVSVSLAGSYYWIASYSGDANNNPIAGTCGDDGETSVVSPAAPKISTQAVDSGLPNALIHDVATVTGLTDDATGTVTFQVWGPSAQPSCTGNPVFTSTVQLSAVANGVAHATSGGFSPSVAGSYWWIASYSGDANNTKVSGACGDDGETSSVDKAHPSISTAATNGELPVGTIHDTATVSGLSANATGTVTFNLYGPSASPSCDGVAVFTATVDLGTVTNGSAMVGSGNFLPTKAGSYYWIASYSGDANNNPIAGSCGEDGETSVVSPATPTITTDVTATPVTLTPNGVDLGDTAHITGATDDATGTITFTVFGPFASKAAVNCDPEAGTVVGTAAVDGNGDYPSPKFHATQAGWYTWTAVYSGDANNEGASHECGLESETVLVEKAPTSVTTSATEQAIIKLGQTISDTATITGVTPDASGTVTFTLYGPGDSECSGEAVFTDTVAATLGSDGENPVLFAQSGDFTPTLPGTYQWVASYSGDDNNAASSGQCGDEGEQSQVFAGDHPGLDKNSDPAPGSVVQPGQQIDYTVTVSNTGDVPIVDKPVVDVLPAHVTPILPIPENGVYDATARTITWMITLGPDGSEEPPSQHVFHYSVTVDEDAPAGAILLNTAKFLGLEDTTTHVVASGGLTIVKAVSPVAGNGVVVNFGDTLTYTLTVKSTGTLDQQDVVVTDYVPGHDPARPTSGTTTYVKGSAACSGTCTIDQPGADGLITWHLGDMPHGTTRTVTFKVTIDTPAANADGSVPAVLVLNAGAVQSVKVPKTPSNEVKTPVSAVLPIKLPRTGLALPLGPTVGGGVGLVLVGLVLLAAARRRDEQGRHRA